MKRPTLVIVKLKLHREWKNVSKMICNQFWRLSDLRFCVILAHTHPLVTPMNRSRTLRKSNKIVSRADTLSRSLFCLLSLLLSFAATALSSADYAPFPRPLFSWLGSAWLGFEWLTSWHLQRFFMAFMAIKPLWPPAVVGQKQQRCE